MSRPVLFRDVTVYSGGQELPRQWVLVANGQIREVAPGPVAAPDGALEIRGSFRLAPGYVDTHIHGYAGHDVMRPGDVPGLARAVNQCGVTAIMPTTVASSPDLLHACLASIDLGPTDGARVLGIHAEGPYISPQQPGMLAGEEFARFESAAWRALQGAARGAIRLMTVAPERLRPEQLALLQDNGVTLSLGHSDATFSQVEAAIASGVRRCTHAFNAMRGFHHREPGMVGAMLSHGELDCELILDGHHVSPPAARLLLDTRTSGRVCLISDAVPPAGLGDGTYRWLDYRLNVADGQSRVSAGNLAGSLLTLDQAVRNAVELLGLSPPRAVQLASEFALRSIGVSEGGTVSPGAPADLVLLDNALQPQMTVVAGRVVWRREGFIPQSV